MELDHGEAGDPERQEKREAGEQIQPNRRDKADAAPFDEGAGQKARPQQQGHEGRHHLAIEKQVMLDQLAQDLDHRAAVIEAALAAIAAESRGDAGAAVGAAMQLTGVGESGTGGMVRRGHLKAHG